MISTEPEPAASNPWLTAGASASSSSKISRKKNAVSGKEASAAEKSAKAFKKSLGKVEEAREREQDDAMVDIDPSQVSLAKKAGDKGKGRARAEESEDEDEESQDDHERKGPLALRQRDLVAQAFAGDNVLEVRHTSRQPHSSCPGTDYTTPSLPFPLLPPPHRTLPRRSARRRTAISRRTSIQVCQAGCVPLKPRLQEHNTAKVLTALCDLLLAGLVGRSRR